MSLIEYKLENHLAIITMKRAEKKNALNEELLNDLRNAWTDFKNDDEAWIAIITGEGDVFSAGADKSFIQRFAEGEDFWNTYLNLTQKDPFLNNTINKPTISAINGSAFGGGFDLALQADFRISVESAVFRMPEPDFGGVLILWNNLPQPIAAEMMTGFPISAKRAYEIGILNRIVPTGMALKEAVEFANTLLNKPPLTIRKNIQIVRDLYAKASPISRYTLLDYSTQVGNQLARTDDWQVAIKAFLEKEVPVYHAR